MRDKEAIVKAVSDMDIVIHLVATVSVGQSIYQIKKCIACNTYGTANLLDVIVNGENNSKKLEVISIDYENPKTISLETVLNGSVCWLYSAGGSDYD